ncbi:rod shape-determining protein MreD [Priestia taiwanensis]|uniref:Rod shape-determining protein MreD n=1 Tax=Priestia taiwanensis TaxID=1347902 RepID=A0A917AV67_9BACI|nr:rod shape-determining protein MreD [Priestia taiwanensis]MBM7363607.1 rod shape-determining protein MreD [Priestia taiwanensis]GGE75683.1 rod shape-determining protein MreD [Priestia taiwanensis]
MKRYFLPVLFVVLFVSEGVFASIFPVVSVGKDVILVPYFLFIGILFMSAYYNQMQAFYYGLIFGFLFDLVYTEVLGVYVFVFPILAFGFARAMKVLHSHLVIVSVLSLIAINILEYYVYGFTLLIGKSEMAATPFLLYRLFPSLLLNLVFLVLFAKPLQNYFEAVKKEKEAL